MKDLVREHNISPPNKLNSASNLDTNRTIKQFLEFNDVNESIFPSMRCSIAEEFECDDM